MDLTSTTKSSPSLIVGKSQVDYFIKSLDETFCWNARISNKIHKFFRKI